MIDDVTDDHILIGGINEAPLELGYFHVQASCCLNINETAILLLNRTCNTMCGGSMIGVVAEYISLRLGVARILLELLDEFLRLQCKTVVLVKKDRVFLNLGSIIS